jgi:pimeloyl-ACP methyl ester carboxylesterase
MDVYIDSFHSNNLSGPMNWYRTGRVNYEDELSLPSATENHLPMPVLFVQALKDEVLIPAMSVGMERMMPKLSRAEVHTGHWALWQAPSQVSAIIGKWLSELILADGGRGIKL